MEASPTAEQVLSDIEFELVQGAISQDELGQSIQAVRQFQNKTRGEVFQSGRRATDSREIASKQFQINDMLITLLQEAAARIQRLEMELRQTSRMLPDTPPTSADPVASPSKRSASIPGAVGFSTSSELDEDPYRWIPAQVESAMRLEELHVEPEVRPAGMPIIGGLLTRLRTVLHNLPLFYIRRLAGKQAAVNKTYGDWILHLNRLQQQQQEQIKALGAQLAALQAHLTEGEHSR